MNVIHSGLLKKITEQYDVFLISDLIKTAEIEQINIHFNTPVQLLDHEISDENFWVNLIRKVEKLMFFYSFNIETQNVKNKSQSRIFHSINRIVALLFKVFCMDKVLLIWLRNLIIRISSRSKSLAPFVQFGFSGIISTSPLDIRENIIVNFFNARNVKSMALIISWDNLTSKGVINADHDNVLVWNQLMADEYQQFYGIFKHRKTKVRVTGIPRFDVYFENPKNDHFRLKYGISISEKIILFATSAAKHFPNQAEIVRDLIEYGRDANITILVRCHPADDYDRYYSFLSEPKLIIWRPNSENSSQVFADWLPDPDFLHTLSDMLQNCNVCVQVASTMRLDAAACGKPIISIAYDGSEALPYHQSVRRFYDYSHQIPLNKLGIDQMVHNKQQLFNALDKLLNVETETQQNPLIGSFIHHPESKSVDSTIQNIQEWLT